MNMATVYMEGLNSYRKAEELYQRAIEGYEAQLGKDHEDTNELCRELSCLCFLRQRTWLKLRTNP